MVGTRPITSRYRRRTKISSDTVALGWIFSAASLVEISSSILAAVAFNSGLAVDLGDSEGGVCSSVTGVERSAIFAPALGLPFALALAVGFSVWGASGFAVASAAVRTEVAASA